ncbi:MAG: SPOR domain-containing protein [Sulfuricurvum sp.]
MEEKNELNDIILNKRGAGSNSKKLLLAIAALTLILIVVLVIMNSLKSDNGEAPVVKKEPQAQPSAPTEVIDDPLFEPVEVIQEGNNATSGEDLDKIAQKIKQESYDSASAQPSSAPAPTPAPVSVPAPTAVPTAAKPLPKPAAAPVSTPVPAATKPTTVAPAPAVIKAPKVESKPVQAPAKAESPVVKTPTIKSVKAAEAKPEMKKVSEQPSKPAPKPAEKPTQKATEGGTWYIQVGSFSKEPDQKLFERIKANGMQYKTIPNGSVTKVLIGPFEGKAPASDAIGNVRKNIEANAFITKG